MATEHYSVEWTAEDRKRFLEMISFWSIHALEIYLTSKENNRGTDVNEEEKIALAKRILSNKYEKQAEWLAEVEEKETK